MDPRIAKMWKSPWLRRGLALLAMLLLLAIGLRYSKNINWNPSRSIGQPMDSLDGVVVHYNGGVGQSHSRNTSPDGYNIGLRYQCVEFVKRYYLEVYHHKMPDSYGHAKDFFDPNLADGRLNKARGLRQYVNGGQSKPQKGDLLVWGPSLWNPYGHVAIVRALGGYRSSHIESLYYIQQNPGPFGDAQGSLSFIGPSQVKDRLLLGWLRMPN